MDVFNGTTIIMDMQLLSTEWTRQDQSPREGGVGQDLQTQSRTCDERQHHWSKEWMLESRNIRVSCNRNAM